MTDELDKIIKELEVEKPKEDEKAKPEKSWKEEESESNITEAEFNKLDSKGKEKYGV